MGPADTRALAVTVLRYVAAFDRREITDDEVSAWAQVIGGRPENAPEDYRAAVEMYYSQPQDRNAKAGDIVDTATRLRRRRLGLDALPRLERKGVPMPPELRERFGLS